MPRRPGQSEGLLSDLRASLRKVTQGSADAVQHLAGLGGCATALVAALAHLETRKPVLCVSRSATDAQATAGDVRSLLAHVVPAITALPAKAPTVRLLLPSEHSPYDAVHPDRRTEMARTATLSALATGRPCDVLVTTAGALLRRVVPGGPLAAACHEITRGQVIEPTELRARLVRGGFARAAVVEDPGMFAVRGGLMDVWAPGSRRPARIEWFGDTVAELRSFDPETQRSGGKLGSLWLPPARELLVAAESGLEPLSALRELCDEARMPSGKTRLLLEDLAEGRSVFGAEGYLPAAYSLVPLWDHLGDDWIGVLQRPDACVAALREEAELAEKAFTLAEGRPRFPIETLYVDPERAARRLLAGPLLCCHKTLVAGRERHDASSALELAPPETPELGFEGQEELARAIAGQSKAAAEPLSPLLSRLAQWLGEGYHVRFTARTEVQAHRLATLLSERDIPTSVASGSDGAAPGVVQVVVTTLSQGLIAPGARLVLVTEEEIFGRRSHRGATRKQGARAALEDLRALAPGDRVVHVEHGIGKYLGLERKQLGPDSAVDLLIVEYRGGDKLFVPVYRLNQIQKLSGADTDTKLDRLGGQTFAKTKAKVKKKVRDMADELLALYAERGQSQKIPLPPVDSDYLAFEAGFPFEETPDQAAAIQDVLDDLDKPQVMDRLVCGDVGFGKTEVALRAAFRHVTAGRQVALLCPTTVLANQHYHTVLRRFSDQPVTVDLLSRFRNKKQQAATTAGLEEGRIDIVVGTHRLLSKDVRFKRLGLLVVDEEQRFGVAAKERIKQLKKDVDVLTLSATPIPRTLQMAVGGLQDLSIIATPPTDRRAVRTTTARFDETLVREVIERELDRGGQVYYVHNRVEGIYERAMLVQRLVPRAKVAIGHGQMRESELEKTMLGFESGETDVLVATAIVESGLDIPRANTLIVDRADLFGLAQLYQLRGRVGRASERAYCYLLVPTPSRLTDEARMRVEALTRYTELGSGLHIAELDLELRGAGDFLGAEQSGAVASVGFELFCQMLEEAKAELSGKVVQHEVDPEISLDTEALLPEAFVPEVGVRLSLYKRLASCREQDEVHALAVEIEDRFGPLPASAQSLVALMRLKTQLRELRVTACDANARAVTLHLRADTPLVTERLMTLVGTHPATHRLTPRGQVVRTPTERESSAGGLELAARLVRELQRCL